MNHKLSGVIFILFGLGLTGDSAYELYGGVSSLDFATIKSALLLLLGVASCIYGYKQFTNTLYKDRSV